MRTLHSDPSRCHHGVAIQDVCGWCSSRVSDEDYFGSHLGLRAVYLPACEDGYAPQAYRSLAAAENFARHHGLPLVLEAWVANPGDRPDLDRAKVIAIAPPSHPNVWRLCAPVAARVLLGAGLSPSTISSPGIMAFVDSIGQPGMSVEVRPGAPIRRFDGEEGRADPVYTLRVVDGLLDTDEGARRLWTSLTAASEESH